MNVVICFENNHDVIGKINPFNTIDRFNMIYLKLIKEKNLLVLIL